VSIPLYSGFLKVLSTVGQLTGPVLPVGISWSERDIRELHLASCKKDLLGQKEEKKPSFRP